jgi:hypothetical protein
LGENKQLFTVFDFYKDKQFMTKQIWLVLIAVGIIASVALVATITLRSIWPTDYVQGQLEIPCIYVGINSEGVAIYDEQKRWLVADKEVYNLEFLPFCEFVGCRVAKDTNSFLEDGATYRAKGDITTRGSISSSDGQRKAYTMQVYYLEYVRSADNSSSHGPKPVYLENFRSDDNKTK